MSLGRQHLRRIRPLVDGRHSLPPFFCSADRTMAGVHDFFRRFSHSLSRVISKKVRWSSNEGHGPLEVRSPGAFCYSFHQVQNLLPGGRRTKCWLCSDVLIDVVQKMNHSSLLLRLQSFLGESQQLIFSGFDGGSPPFGFGVGHTEGP